MIAKITPFGLLVGRIMLGVVFMAHGWQKWTNGVDTTAQGFDHLGIPAPTLAAYFTVGVELIGGALFILGALLPLIGLAWAGTMLGAMYFVHLDGGFYSRDGGFEYVLTLAVLALVIGFSGGGKWALDSLWLHRLDREKHDEEAMRPAPAGSAV